MIHAEGQVDKRELKGATEIAIPGYEHKVVFGVLTSFAYKLKDSGLITLCQLDRSADV